MHWLSHTWFYHTYNEDVNFFLCFPKHINRLEYDFISEGGITRVRMRTQHEFSYYYDILKLFATVIGQRKTFLSVI